MAKGSGKKESGAGRRAAKAKPMKKTKSRHKTVPDARKNYDEPIKELKEVVPGYEHRAIEYAPEENSRMNASGKKEQPRTKLKKPSRPLKMLIIIGAAAIIAVLVLFFVFAKLRFVLNDELSINIKPLHQSFSVENNDTITAKISITNNNFARCSAECSFSLKDISTGTIIYSDSKVLKHKEELEEEFNIEMPGKGSGQRIYSFESDCRNIKTITCLTDGESRFESANIIANFGLREEELKMISEKRPAIERWLFQVKELRGLYSQFKKTFIVLPEGTDKEGLEAALAESVPQVVRIVDASERLADAWSSEDYSSLGDYFSQELAGSTDALIGFFKDSIQAGVELVDERNSNIELLKQAAAYQNFSAELLAHCANESSPENDVRLKELSSIAHSIVENYNSIIGKALIGEDDLGKLIAQSIDGLERMKLVFAIEKEKTEALIANGSELLRQKNPEINITFGEGCDGLRELSAEFEKENNSSAGNENNDTEKQDAELQSVILLDDSENKAQLAAFCKAGNHTSNASPEEVNRIKSFISLDFQSLDAKKIISFPGPEEIPSQTTLPDNPPICCVNAKCSPCCADGNCYDDESYPVIFIHGHAFNDANNPDYSLLAFSKMQRKMGDEGFISFGELDLETDLEGSGKEWGMIGLPITVRASYYYITHYELGSASVNVQKSESIENYALRLREIIDLVRKKTGSPKVNLVAHSMGGLVTRQYLELFGYGEVDKVILIGTPNHGVGGKVQKLCSLLGARKECSELAEDSIFLKRLNSKPVPEGIKLYSIRSTGCLMDEGEDGDGIVTSSSAYLEGATNYEIKGSCTSSFGTDLHTDSLDPEKYPEMYELVLRILKE